MHTSLTATFRNTAGNLGHSLLVYYRELLSHAGYMGEGVSEEGKGIMSTCMKEIIVQLRK